MSSVCAFLTMLERDAAEANGNVRRMLSVCSEFERIAKVVLDKAERDMRGRGKRKATERGESRRDKASNGNGSGDGVTQSLDDGKTLEQIQVETQAAYRRPVQTPSLIASSGSGTGASPASWGNSPPNQGQGQGHGQEVGHGSIGFQQRQQALLPETSAGHWSTAPPNFPQHVVANGGTPGSGSFSQGQPMEYQHHGSGSVSSRGGTGSAQQTPPQPHQQPPNNFSQSMGDSFPASTGFTSSSMSGMDPMTAGLDLSMSGAFGASPEMVNGGGVGGSFQQPFVPQDLWQMPMTLEWDWAEGLGLGGFTPGPIFDMGYPSLGDGGPDGSGDAGMAGHQG